LLTVACAPLFGERWHVIAGALLILRGVAMARRPARRSA
jgi:hypothetical protein